MMYCIYIMPYITLHGQHGLDKHTHTPHTHTYIYIHIYICNYVYIYYDGQWECLKIGSPMVPPGSWSCNFWDKPATV